MAFGLMNINSSLVQKYAVDDIMSCNDFTVNYGLMLTQSQAISLVKTRTSALTENGRVELGGGIIDKIIKAFCDSQYLNTRNYSQTLHELIEIFYYYKNETLDLISDDDLITEMKDLFNGVCQGSLELLAGSKLNDMAKNLRFGLDKDYLEADDLDEDEEASIDGEY